MKRRIINNICDKCNVSSLLLNTEIYDWFYNNRDKNIISARTGLGPLERTIICFDHMSEKTNDDIERFISAIDRLIIHKMTDNRTHQVKDELREILVNWFRKESDW